MKVLALGAGGFIGSHLTKRLLAAWSHVGARADREIDLFHLANCRPELGLLERYLQEIEPDALFQARYMFYRFWDDVKHYVRMGWYEEGRFRRYGDELMAAMREMRLD